MVAVVEQPIARERREQEAHPPPVAWVRRLREISPRTDRTSYLWLAWSQDPHTATGIHRVERWTIHQCVPRALLPRDRIAQLVTHWSDLPTDEQAGRRMMVSDFQHYFFRTHGADARRMWVLQGFDVEEWSGTPAGYTDRERLTLRSVQQATTVPPAGTLPYMPFDERCVRALLERDRLLRYQMDLDRMEAAFTPLGARHQLADAERAGRKAFLDWWSVRCAPQAEFLRWMHTKPSQQALLPRATKRHANAASQFREHYLETGDVPAIAAS